ncbi:arginine kinase-like [Anopheles aquasalis]|uniref:arginine kinase-like n=1 Tax=Anopheles aquasalis TaxID=42839 RepID=UPI00215A5EBB|nr:arginine kinase-like [Anopheles aquasalis]
MASLEQKREAFRKYLESAGAIDCLSKALIRLYQEEQKPENACKFLRQCLCEDCPTDEQVAQAMEDLDEARRRVCQLEREVRDLKANVRPSASECNLALDSGFEELQAADSLLKKHLTRELLDELKGQKTTVYRSTLLDCIQSGLTVLDSRIGLYAADPEAYKLFAGLFDPIIAELHGEFGADSAQPELNWGTVEELENPDPEGQYVRSTRVRCARSLEGYPFHPRMQEDQYEKICDRVRTALEQGLPEELRGQFHPLETLEESLRVELLNDHCLFRGGDRFQEAAQAYRFYPTGRALFLNEARTFHVWINEEDHLRIISMQQGSDVGQVYRRFIDGVEAIAKQLPLLRDERLGYVSFCPSNLGTGIRASVHIRLPKLAADRARLNELVGQHGLEVRSTNGEGTCDTSTKDCEDGVLDVSNKRRLGLTEFETVKLLVDGVKALIEVEKELAAAEDVPAAAAAAEEEEPAAAAEEETPQEATEAAPEEVPAEAAAAAEEPAE